MIIVDDKLSLDVLAGRLTDIGHNETVATTWGFHHRLVRALAGTGRAGHLSTGVTQEVRELVRRPPSGVLSVLDPRTVTADAADLAVRHELNLLAAELVAAAKFHGAEVWLSAPNVGRRWRALLRKEAIRLRIR